MFFATTGLKVTSIVCVAPAATLIGEIPMIPPLET